MVTRHPLPSLPFSLLILFLFSTVAGASETAPKKTYFPEFNVIAGNVAFWERVYAEFSINTAIVHDRENLSIIYETVPLLDTALPGATRLNRTYLKAVRKKYTTLLTDLGKGKPAQTALEKRVMQLFPGPDIRSQMRQAAGNIRIQMGLKERFLEGVIRSGRYIDEMKAVFRSYDLPEDLAYLPHVESSFNFKAYSKFGAAGVWQFTHATGKNFMTIDYIVDERRDPLAATHAAAKYLSKNFANLGTWPLAITAYNYGHAGMLRAVKQEGNYENIFRNYRKGHFKFASRNFYSEFLAARNVAKSLERIPEISRERPMKCVSYTMPAYAAAAELASHLGLSMTELKELNPALRPPVWNGEKFIPKGYSVRLPHAGETLQRLQRMPPTIFQHQQKRSNFYTVRRGDTAGEIARRFGVSLSSLSKANNLNKNRLVYIGQTLRIPGSGSGSTAAIVAASSGPTTILKGGKKSLPAWKVSPTLALPVNADLHVAGIANGKQGKYGEIIVQPEESMALYTEWLQTEERTVLALNGLRTGAALHPGQRLKIPLHTVSQRRFEEQRIEFHQETEEDFFSAYRVTGFRKYTVALGDTLWDLCQNKFDLPLWLLKKYNHNLQYNNLASNQDLQIPIIEAL